MEYVVEKMAAMKMIGFERVIPTGLGYQEAPRFWDEFLEKYLQLSTASGNVEKEIQQAIEENQIGEFGICIDNEIEEGYFRYMIAGRYTGGKVPEKMKIFEIPACDWAKFKCVGTMPEAFQVMNTRIFKEWLPGNSQYEPAMSINIEWYSAGDAGSDSYESSIWIPVKERQH